jgi:D-alanyl-D-alanine carboxypeptidase
MTRVTRAQARRRRTFTALMSVSVLALIVILWPKGQSDQLAAPSRTAPAASATGTQATSSEPLPAWLAWMSGGFPSTFRDRIRGADGLTRTVVVAGDTRWMTASHDASGVVVDQPTPPYMIPLDAFAVEPTEYAPFLPSDQRDAIVTVLDKGEAVLGQTSSELRRLGPGGSLSFGNVTVKVGAVAPDDVVGWSEMLVNRDVGRRLGITDERYLLAFADPAMTLPHFTTDVRSLLPAGSYLRTVPPGGTRFVRVASGVNPPVVMKTVFGEFDAYPRSDDPAYLNIDPAWYDAHIRTRTVPLLGAVTCNEQLFPALVGALTDVEAAGLGGAIHVYSGCYAARTVARSTTAPPSNHAYGAAIDINAPENPYGSTPTMNRRIVKIFEHWGFDWGGNFLIPDGMHFEYRTPPPANA